MKHYLFIILLIISGSACKSVQPSVAYERTGEVNCIDFTASTINLRSVARGGTSSQAVYFAERNALENLLFKGIPDCTQRRPLIEDEQAFLNKHGSYYKQLIQKDYVKFVTQSETLQSEKLGEVLLITQAVVFDLPALRSELENRGIIRKFGL